jgi:type I restriction enzyme S subunit
MEEQTNSSASAPRPLPPGWSFVRVDQAGDVRLGRQRSPDQYSGAYPTKYIRAANITPAGLNLGDLLEMNFTPAEREIFGLQSGDVLLTEASGSASQVGRAAVWRGEIELCCYQNTVIRFRPHLTTPEFALLVFRHYAAAGVFAQAARGVGIQHLGGTRFAQLELPLPPIAEQRRITQSADQRLSEIREAEARLRSAQTHLDDQMQEILAAAVAGDLVRHEVVRSPASRRLPSAGDQPSLFADERTPITELANFIWSLPPAWYWTRIDEVGTAILGRQRSPQHARGSHMRPYLRVANVFEDRIDFSDLKEMNFTPEEVATYALQAGDILLNEGQSPELVGRPALYHGEMDDLCFQNHLIRFRANEAVLPAYALIVFRHYMHSGVFRQIARWSTNIANMGLERFRSLPFPVPPLEEQARIVSEARRRLDATAGQLEAVRVSLSRLPEFERELLAAAVAGELTPQDPNDEPAGTLIQRLGPPPRTLATPATPSHRGDSMSKRRPRAAQMAESAPDLAAVLRRSGGALSLPELFTQAGYDRDLPEHVELFASSLFNMGRNVPLASADRPAHLIGVSWFG